MFIVRDLFQWERFITPSIIRIFYALAVIIALLVGVSGIISAINVMQLSPLAGVGLAVGSVFGALISILVARIVAELVLIVFRINDHLGVLRSRAEM